MQFSTCAFSNLGNEPIAAVSSVATPSPSNYSPKERGFTDCIKGVFVGIAIQPDCRIIAPVKLEISLTNGQPTTAAIRGGIYPTSFPSTGLG